jgi:hypothetical protein
LRKNQEVRTDAEAAASLVEEIRFAYPKRPALLDELPKL